MFKPGKGFCKGCEKETLIVVKKGLCGRCNEASKPKKSTTTKPNKPAKKYVKKATGEKYLFLRIWDERPHVCEQCCIPLGDEPKVHFFSHTRAKSISPELRLDKSNLQLLCFDCHYLKDFGSKEEFNERKDLYYGSDTEV